jgi:hypothetical protein
MSTTPASGAPLAIAAAAGLVALGFVQGRKGSSALLVARKGRWYPNFYGSRHGSYEEYEEPILRFRAEGFDWEMAASLSSVNEWKNWCVEGATEQSPGFISALREIVWEYPEAASFKIKFDGPWQSVSDVLDRASRSPTLFLHGTSSTAWEQIQRRGLLPRQQSGSRPAYGAHLSHAAASDPEAVYLTTQLGTASWAARDAVRTHGGAPTILEVDARDLDEDKLRPDEDSRSTSWRESLEIMGSVKYKGQISPRSIRIHGSGSRDEGR